MNAALPTAMTAGEPGYRVEHGDFINQWRRVRPYLWPVIGLGFVGLLVAVFYAQTLPRIYRTSATLLIESKLNRAVQVQEVYDPGVGTSDYLNTQFEVLRSRELLARVVDRLKLVDRPEFAPQVQVGIWQRLGKQLPMLPQEEPAAFEETPAAARERVIDAVLHKVVVEPVVRTQLVRVGFDSVNPQLAQDVSNDLANAYIESGLESRLAATRKASQWLTGKLTEIKSSLEQSELALQKYREQEQLVVVGGDRGLLDNEVIDNSQRLRDAQKTKLELQSTYEKIRSAGDDLDRLDVISSLIASPGVAQTRSSYLLAQEQLKQVEDRYGDKHPQMAEARTRFQSARRAYNDQLSAAAQGVRAQYEVAAQTERQLSGAVAGAKVRIRDLDRKQYQAGVLEREATTNRELYDLFLKRFKETDTAGSYEPINARIIDTARLPDWPFKPSVGRIHFMGLLLGLLVGCALAWLHLALSEGVGSALELERLTQTATLAVVPYVRKRSSRRNLGRSVIDEPKSPYAEAIRSLRVAIKFSEIDKPMRRVAVTSSLPGEGKSCTAAALACSLAAHERVLLLECDLRLPSLRTLFPPPKRTPGLMEVLLKQAQLEECMQKYDYEHGFLHVLSVSSRPPNPGEVISSAALRELLDQLSPAYDRVIIDTPPIQAASDVLTVAQMCDGVLMVVKADDTPHDAIAAAIRQLRNIQVRVLGNVLNQVNINRHRAYAGSYYYADR